MLNTNILFIFLSYKCTVCVYTFKKILIFQLYTLQPSGVKFIQLVALEEFQRVHSQNIINKKDRDKINSPIIKNTDKRFFA